MLKEEIEEDIFFVPKTAFKQKLFYMMKSSFFEFFIMILIVGNTIVLSVEYDDQPASYDLALTNTSHFFSACFICELIVKVWVYGFYFYLASDWNKFPI